MPKLTKRAIRYVRTDGPTLIIEKLRFLKQFDLISAFDWNPTHKTVRKTVKATLL